ncbi:MAG: NdvB protein [Colwellia sp.]
MPKQLLNKAMPNKAMASQSNSSKSAAISIDKNKHANVMLNSPTRLPKSCGFLWNKKMVLQVNCRGYINAQFMQPEPSKYSYAPNIEAKTFIQPEHSYFTHHPGRFFYIKDEDSNEMFSLPYEPMRVKLDKFSFNISESKITWLINHLNLEVNISVSLAKEDVLERWSLTIKNLAKGSRNISVYPYFSIGYMSWMNQSAIFTPKLNAIVASAITPYQKVDEYYKNQKLKDKTFFVANKEPNAWHTAQQTFEGEGGLHNPDALQAPTLANVKACYDTPVAVMQFRETLDVEEEVGYQFLFGPAKDDAEIAQLSARYLGQSQAQQAQKKYDDYIATGKGCLTVTTDDIAFDNFVNHWLPRQMFYHGDVNRLSTDPQTRNYIQDNMGMSYIKPKVAREAFILALSQQQINGAMPDGILLHEAAELKYINQVPHADHCVWLPICLATYLCETGDTELLNVAISFTDSNTTKTFSEHIELALDWLLAATDYRGLSFIEQGDWCDPMNMVGHKGKGVSAWLSLATAYAINSWCELSEQYQLNMPTAKLKNYRHAAKNLNQSVNKHLWQDDWFARGITDEGRVFGIKADEQGKIFLNPQSWAMLSGAANQQQQKSMINAINQQLMTPYGVMMLAPSYTQMVEDIGRVTQKYPGVSENGSVYNHAAIFYAYALYQVGENDLAFEVISKILPSFEQAKKTGQLPVYVPNYYRGAFHQFPEQAGLSSHLFNTGTVSWLYRCLVEELCGLKGSYHGLLVVPKLPSKLNKISGQRLFRGAVINFVIEKSAEVATLEIRLDDKIIPSHCLNNLIEHQIYQLKVRTPLTD